MQSSENKPLMLFICNEFNYPTKTGAHVRIINLIKLYSKKYRIYLIVPKFDSCDSVAWNNFYDEYITDIKLIDYTHNINSVGIMRYLIGPRTLLDFNPQPFICAITNFLLDNGIFDVIHVGRWFMTDVVKKDLKKKSWAKNYILDFDASDFNVRTQNAKDYSGGWLGALKVRVEPWRVRIWEHRFLSKFDAVFVSSPKEIKELDKRTKCKKLLLLINGYDAEKSQKVSHQIARNIILYVGGLDYEPNLNGFRYFINNVWPLVRKEVPNAEFWHVGVYPQEIKAWAERAEGVLMKGFVKDLAEIYPSAAVVVSPIFYGSGTRIKILEAAAYGKAIVATESAAEGLDFTDKLDIAFANDDRSIADRCIELLQNHDIRMSLGKCAQELIKKNYSWSEIGSSMEDGLERLLK